MNREAFLDKIFTMYQRSFTNDNKQEWWNAYKRALSEDIDFDHLYTTMILEYDQKTAPTPAWLNARASFIARKEPESVTFKNIWATSPFGTDDLFGYNPETEKLSLMVENLRRRGFTNIREG